MTSYRQGLLGLLMLMMWVLVACGRESSDSDATLTSDQATEQARLSGFVPITRNADWIPVEREFDGVVMVLVPVGCFMMGEGNVAHEQCFDEPFWIDKYEVTNKQFRDFGGVAVGISGWAEDDVPRERIMWFEARDFCALRGGRLPSEREWEYAARGPNNLIYPWGNDFVADNVVFSDNSGGRTDPVGSRTAGASWVGTMDMAGNVWEWVSSLYVPYPYTNDNESTEPSRFRVIRGGSWIDPAHLVRSATRNGVYPSVTGPSLGFRCVRAL